MKPKVYIRADASPQIGLGHLVRCFALAQMLENDFEISFVCKEIPESMEYELHEKRYKLTRIQYEKHFFKYLSSNSIVILDGYHFNTNYQKQIKSSGSKLVCIDDLHDKEFVADLIINHTPGITPHDYLARPYTQFALGLKYALLRPAFLEQANKERQIEKIENLLICFGGSDPKNLTQIVLEIAIEFSLFKKIYVVTGSGYCKTEKFDKLVSSDSRIEHRLALDEKKMLSTMLESDLAIVPASGILLEILTTGCVPLIGYYVENQRIFHDFMHKEHGIRSYSIGNKTINDSIRFELSDLLKNGAQNTLISNYQRLLSSTNNNILIAFKNLSS